MLGKIRIIKGGSGLVRIIPEVRSLTLLLRKRFRVYQNTQHFFDLPKLIAEELELTKNSNYRESKDWPSSSVFFNNKYYFSWGQYRVDILILIGFRLRAKNFQYPLDIDPMKNNIYNLKRLMMRAKPSEL